MKLIKAIVGFISGTALAISLVFMAAVFMFILPFVLCLFCWEKNIWPHKIMEEDI